IGDAADDRGIAVGRQRNSVPLTGIANRAGAKHFRTLLAPDAVAVAREHPCRAGVAVVVGAPDNRGTAVGRQRDQETLLGCAARAGADELAALLTPGAAVAGKDPSGAGKGIVVVATGDRRIAVGR